MRPNRKPVDVSPIDLSPLDSGNLASHGYHGESRRLAIGFHGGAVWHYHDVPPDVMEAFKKAKSKGTFFAARIKNVFKATQVAAATPKKKAARSRSRR